MNERNPDDKFMNFVKTFQLKFLCYLYKGKRKRKKHGRVYLLNKECYKM